MLVVAAEVLIVALLEQVALAEQAVVVMVEVIMQFLPQEQSILAVAVVVYQNKAHK